MQTSTLLHYNKLKVSSGFTLIELIIVIVIIGSMMTLGLNLLQSIWQKQASGITSLEFIQIVDKAREKSLAEGQIYTLLINEDKHVMELRTFDPEKERVIPDFEIVNKYNNEDTKKSDGVIFRANLPPDIEEFYSTSGIKLTAPVIFFHFYPDGTSDSIIVKYKNRTKQFQFIPRNGGKGVFISEINHLGYEN